MKAIKKITLSKKDSAKKREIIHPDSLIGKTLYLISAKVDFQGAMKNPLSLLGGGGKEVFKEDTSTFKIVGILKKAGPFSTSNLKGGAIIPAKAAMNIPTLDFLQYLGYPE